MTWGPVTSREEPALTDLPFYFLSTIWCPTATKVVGRHVANLDIELEKKLDVGRRFTGKLPLRLESNRAAWLEDFPFSTTMIMSERAAQALGKLISSNGEFLPAVLERRGKRLPARYVVFNCLTKLDVLDRRHLRPDDWSSPGWLSPYAKVRFQNKKLAKSVHAFRIVDYILAQCVSHDVRKVLTTSNLTGWMLVDPHRQQKVLISEARPTRNGLKEA